MYYDLISIGDMKEFVIMEKQKPYLTQYCNIKFEWHSTGIDIDKATKSQRLLMQDIRLRAVAESGLTDNELTLIAMCRNYGIFEKVNIYAHQIKRMKPP